MIKDISKYYKLITLTLLAVFLLIIISLYLDLERNNKLEVVYLDIGQGDSQLIKTPAGQNILIDTGPNYITAQKIEQNLPKIYGKLDAIPLTHPDLDHVGGTDEVLASVESDTLILSSENEYDNYNVKDGAKIYRIHKGQNVNLYNDLILETKSPEADSIGDINHNSIVSSLKYGNYEFIFTGDADASTERTLIAEGVFDNSYIKILKVGHHGSNTSSSEIFLRNLKPEYCLISVGLDNSYGHPGLDAMEILEKYCKNIYRTDKDGDISFLTDGYNLTISKTK